MYIVYAYEHTAGYEFLYTFEGRVGSARLQVSLTGNPTVGLIEETPTVDRTQTLAVVGVPPCCSVIGREGKLNAR